MMPTRWPRRFTSEGATVGRLLTGYVKLEIDLMNCVQMGRNGDLDTVLKTMFGARGEARRITEAYKLGSPAYAKQRLQRDFDRAIAALRHCLLIRNQYAHWIWWDDYTGKLAFANLEQLAKQKRRIVDLGKLRSHHVDLGLLTQQENYFAYTDALLTWINFEGRRRAGLLSPNPIKKPKRLRKPKLRLR